MVPSGRYPLLVACLLTLSQPAWASWPCPQEGDVDGDGKADRLELSLQAAGVQTAKGVLPLSLPAPAITRACLGKVERNRPDLIVVQVLRSTPKDPTIKARLFLFSVKGQELFPHFLGTEGGGTLLDFGLMDLDGDGVMEVLAQEAGEGKATTRVYAWQGYSLTEAPALAAQAPPYARAEANQIPSLGPPVALPLMLEAKELAFERSPGRIRPLRVKESLAGVANRDKFADLSPEAKKHLAAQGFVVIRPQTPPREVHSLYIENQYRGLPSFVSSDAALHLTHLLLDHVLEVMEVKVLAPALMRLVKDLHERALEWRRGVPMEVAELLDRVLVRLEVARLLLDGDHARLDPARAAQVVEEVGRLERAAGPRDNPLGMDYPSFAPRGHYDRSETLKRYFRAYLFLSTAGTKDPGEAALTTALALSGERTRHILSWFEAFGRAMAGPPASLTPLELQHRALAAFGENPGWGGLAGRVSWMGEGPQACAGKPLCNSVTLLARRWPADQEMLLLGVDPTSRPFPDPLDWMAMMGSERARELLAQEIGRWPELERRLETGRLDLRQGRLEDRSSISSRLWLTLRWLVLPYPEGYASFQRSEAWQGKQLVTAAASWAELRHDTALYVQPPIVWMEGGDEDALPPGKAGYVEAVPELYQELAEVVGAVRRSLVSFAGEGAQEDDGHFRAPGPSMVLGQGEEVLRFLAKVARKELAGQGLSAKEHGKLCTMGSWFEEILAGRGKIRLEPSPVVAEVYRYGDPATGKQWPLQAATGPLDELIVAVPLGKRVILARGVALSYYQLRGEPALTDKQWRERLDRGEAPQAPPWSVPVIKGGRDGRRSGLEE